MVTGGVFVALHERETGRFQMVISQVQAHLAAFSDGASFGQIAVGQDELLVTRAHSARASMPRCMNQSCPVCRNPSTARCKTGTVALHAITSGD